MAHRSARLLAGLTAVVLAAACGSTVPVNQQGSTALGSGGDGLGQTSGTSSTGGDTTGSTSGGLAGTTTGTSGTTGFAGSTGGGSSTTSGGTTTGGVSNPGSTTGSSSIPAPTGGIPTKGPGWDAKHVYIGVPTANDFNAAAAKLGANFNNGDIKADINAILNNINASGGLFGRQVVAAYNDAPTANYTSDGAGTAQKMCTYFTQDRPVVAVFNGFPQLDAQPTFHSCLEHKKVTLLTATNTNYSNKDYSTLGPHLWTVASLSTDILVPEFVKALKRQNFFTSWDNVLGAPSKTAPVKVGLLLPDDAQGHHVATLMLAGLKQLGVTTTSPFFYNPSGSGSASASEVLQFKSDNVTHFLTLPPVEAEVALFQSQAETQHYRPRHGFTSFDLPLTVEENAAIDPPAQQNGSMGIGWQPYNDANAAHDPGPTPGRARCLQVLKAGGETFAPTERRAAFVGGLACDALFLLRDALVAGNGFTGDSFLAGMPSAGTNLKTSGIFGGALSANDHGLPGFYRDVQYQTACKCFSYVSGNHPFS